jgi:hypothetical protein
VNEYEIDDAVADFEQDKDEAPNLFAAALALSRLRGWTNSRSDGWQYWAKPKRAAAQLMDLITNAQRDYRKTWERVDITPNQLSRALTPVKSLITREGDDWKDVLNPPPPVDPIKRIRAEAWEEGMAAAKLAAAGIKPAKNPYLD